MELFWILTLETPGRASLTWSGAVTPERGETRAELFSGIRSEMTKIHPELSNANTVFWSLEPNRI